MRGTDFSRRSGRAELMDDPTTDYATFRACLIDLAAVNRLTLAHRPTLAFLADLVRRGLWRRDRPLRLVDLGSGYGDALRAVDRWAARHGLPLEAVGVDLNPWSARAAAEATPPGRPLRWVTADAFDDDRPADVFVSGLFAHHLADEAVVRLLRHMEARAVSGWFVNDLHRHALPHAGFTLLSRVMRWHRFVQHDGPVSIARAFTPADWTRLVDQAGLDPAAVRVSRAFPFRICVARVKG